jgi:hypothetical protein
MKGGERIITSTMVWQEMALLVLSGAIGSLLVHGYQNWLKK